MNKYSNKAIFYLPGIFTIPADLFNYLFNIYNNNREIFVDNVEIGCVYGSPGIIWNGGHYIRGTFSDSDLKHVREMAENWGVPIRFTLSNCLIKEEHLGDYLSNKLTDIFATGNNEIICNSSVLENYLRNKYGDKYRYISSTTKCLENLASQEAEINSNYYLTVLDVDNNKNLEYLSKIKNKSKVEILCNPTCKDNCPNKAAHYEFISKCQLESGIDFAEENSLFNCNWPSSLLYERKIHKNFITPEEIENIYIPMGFSNFKLEGRCTAVPNWIETITYYLIKDEYQMQCRQDMTRLNIVPM